MSIEEVKGDEESGGKCSTCRCEAAEFRVCVYNLKQSLSWNCWKTIFFRIWQYRRRNPITTLFQLIIPPLLVLFWVGIHSTLFTDSKHVGNWTEYGTIQEKDLYNHVCGSTCDLAQPKYMLYYPQSDFSKKIIEELSNSLKSFNIQILPGEKENDLVKYAVIHHLVGKPNLYIGGIYFHHDESTKANDPPKKFHTTIRMARHIPYEIRSMTTFDYIINQPKVYYEFLGIQLGLFRAYENVIASSGKLSGRSGDLGRIGNQLNISVTRNTTEKVKSRMKANQLQIQVRSYPLPPHTEYRRIDGHDCNADLIIQVIFVLGMIPTVFSIIRGPVSEKESGFKLYLRLNGLPRWAYWMSWILNDAIIQVIVVSIQTYLLFLDLNERMGKLVKQGDFSVWLVVLFLYSLSSICFLAFLASFFKRGIMGTYVGATIWLLTYYFLDLYGPPYVISLGRIAKVSMCLVPNGALIWALTLMTSGGTGSTWDDTVHPLDAGEVSLFLVLIMLGFDCVLYYILTLYSDNIRPGDFESRQPWNYFFQGIRCSCSTLEDKSKIRRQSMLDTLENVFRQARMDGTLHFSISDSAVEFQSISKKFKGQTVAVEDVNMRIFDGQCTVILGHRGCGKSTLFRLLCGEYYPSSGTAVVKNEDVRRNPYAVQRNLSICLEKDLLSSAHTVLDHLLLVGRLKGLGIGTSKKKAKKLLELFDLTSHINFFPEQLINYEKRRLSIAMSLMGENKIILLDDPTAGLEDAIKQHIWDILLSLRREKTIIVSTSDIDEAHYLGDRIAIMSKGRIVGAGTPQLLQKLFATGYHLHLNIQPTADRLKILDFVKDCIHSMNIVNNKSRRISKGVAMVMCLVDTQSQNLIINSLDDGNGEENQLQFSYEDIQDEHNLVSDVSTRYLDSACVFGSVAEVDEGDGREADWENPLQMVIQLRISEGANFTLLFSKLENEVECERLGIVEHKLKFNDLETAFEMIESHNDSEEVNKLFYGNPVNSENTIILVNREMFPQTGIYFHIQQLRGLLMKRFWWMWGHWLYVFMVQMMVPVLLLIITIQSTDLLYSSSGDAASVGYNMKEMFSKTRILYNLVNPSKDASEYFQSYKAEVIEHLGRDTTFDIGNTTVQQFFSHASLNEDALRSFYAKYSIGVQIKGDVITALFSPTGFHTGPMSLGLVLNASLKHSFPDSGYSIFFNSFPIESSKQKILKFYVNKGLPYDIDPAVSYAIMLGFGFFIFVSNFVTQPLAERLNKMKGLQMNTSVGTLKYWTSYFIVDFFLSIVLGILLLLCLWVIPQKHAFRDFRFSKNFIVFWALASYTSIVMSYVCSFYFRRAKTGYYAMLSCNQCAGLFTFVLSRTLNTSTAQRISRLVFRILQPYNIPAGFCSLFLQAVENSACDLLAPEVKDALCNKNKLYQSEISRLDQSCCENICHRKGHCKDNADYFDWSHFEADMADQTFTFDYIFLLCHAFLLTVALVVIEKGVTKSLFKKTFRHKHYRKSSSQSAPTDNSAEEEVKRIHDIQQLAPEEKNKLFIIKDVCKLSRKKEALSILNLVAEPGKLMAICGPSCSGKSIIFNIIARFLRTNNGNIYYAGQSLVSWHYSNFLRNIGFCPSTDIFPRKMSGLQMLKLFGRLRGIPESELKSHVDQWLLTLELKKRANQHCELYPHSMKRKLAFALAAIGDPKVLVLDNPFKGMDPESRVQLRYAIQDLLSFQRIVIITTDDIRDLKEFQCKSAFLVNGRVECVTSPELIQQNLTKGYTLTIKLRIHPENVTFDDYAELKLRILKSFPESHLIEEQQNMYKYHIEDKEYKWSTLFTLLESTKAEFRRIIEEYSIRETLLDDVYNSYAVKQRFFKRTPQTWDVFCMTYC